MREMNTLRRFLVLIFGNLIIAPLISLVAEPLQTILYVVLFVSDVLAALDIIGYRRRR